MKFNVGDRVFVRNGEVYPLATRANRVGTVVYVKPPVYRVRLDGLPHGPGIRPENDGWAFYEPDLSPYREPQEDKA